MVIDGLFQSRVNPMFNAEYLSPLVLRHIEFSPFNVITQLPRFKHAYSFAFGESTSLYVEFKTDQGI